MAEIGEVILQHVEKENQITSEELAQRLGKDHQQIVGAVKSLQCLGDVSWGFKSFKLRKVGCVFVADSFSSFNQSKWCNIEHKQNNIFSIQSSDHSAKFRY